jgi:peptide/bleomycin uptake transporter
MFVSFFPRPRLFFWSALAWAALCMAVWYGFASSFFPPEPPPGPTTFVTPSAFVAPSALWFDFYYVVCVAIFAAFWMWFAPHPWSGWSILGSALILFASYFQVQISVALNTGWRGPFYNLIQTALSKEGAGSITIANLYHGIFTFFSFATVYVMVSALSSFLVSHYIFRWRTAMNDYYVSHWSRLRNIEGASQRIQEDTMRFATTMEGLGVSLVRAVLTLVAFLPLLVVLSKNVTELPLIGPVPYSLVIVAVVWSVLGTGLLALIGIRLPGLEFFNQRVEAAYRKELVLGEDDPVRADPPTLSALFRNVRANYFRLYRNFLYFNIGRYVYLQTDNIFPYVVMAPTIIAGKITFGILQQILSAFSEVRSSFQYLVTSWGTIVELISIYKRLLAFEARIYDEPLPSIEALPAA